jgi:hypothetical protein
MTKKMAQDAANAAIDAFHRAVSIAVAAPIRAAGKAATKAPEKLRVKDRRLNARPDTVDFRDFSYVPTLVEVGTELPLAAYREVGVPILDQGREGACTGFGLATVVHYLLRTRDVVPDEDPISPRMLYAMARRYDEWPGETYEGSSCRGAMKGWHKHGVCSLDLWRHDPRKPDNTLDERRSGDARRRPLGAYFRVNHKDLVAMHAAITEVGVLYASASVHSGWDEVGRDGVIRVDDNVDMLGGHAFAIVAYDGEGFWIQNSWGASWGKGGFGRISYEDWLTNGDDAWVARLGVPIELRASRTATDAAFSVSPRARAIAYDDVRPHVVSVGNDGRLAPSGAIGTTPALVRRIVHDDLPRITEQWQKRRLVVYAHGGLVDEDSAVQRVAEYRAAMLDAQCYPLAFIWHSDYWSVLKNVLTEALRRRRPEGAIDGAKDFLLDRLDDALEPLARASTGKASWDEMKENAFAATRSARGAGRVVAEEIAGLASANELEIHLVAHSAGSIFLAPLAQRLAAAPPAGLGLPIASCTLWAPACTIALFEEYYAPLLQNGIDRFALFTLSDRAEREDDCARIYNKSLLYLVSNAFERRARIPVFRPDGEPLLGMAKCVEGRASLQKLWQDPRNAWVQSPNTLPVGDPGASRAATHGAFDDDEATVKATLARILGSPAQAARAARDLSFRIGKAHLAERRKRLNEAGLGLNV